MNAASAPGPLAGPGPDPLPAGSEQWMTVRPDAELAGLDVEAAISRGIGTAGEARQSMFTDAAIAAAIEAEGLGIGPYPVAILARMARAGGVVGALRLPEPLIGAQPTALARRWLEAALAAGGGTDADLIFSRWLEMVATLIAMRRSARSAAGSGPAGAPQAALAADGPAPAADAGGAAAGPAVPTGAAVGAAPGA